MNFEDMIEVEEQASFEVTDLKSADWCISKIGEARRKIQERTEVIQEYIAKFEARLKQLNKADEDTIQAMTAFLRPWAEVEIAKGKSKTVKLPCGEISLRSGREAIEVTDEEAALAWCEVNNPEAIKIKTSLLVSKLDKNNLPPGTKKEFGATTFSVRPDAGLFKLEE